MKSLPTAKIVLDTRTKQRESDESLLKIRVTYCRQPHLFSIGDDSVRLTQKQFEKKRSKETMEKMEVAKKALLIAEEVIGELGTDFTFDSFKKKYKRKLTGRSTVSSTFTSLLSDYFSNRESSYKTKKSYETAVNWVMRYNKKATLSTITSDFVDGLISFMKQEHSKEHGKEMSENTLRIYLRQLRAIYNFATKKGYTDRENPFAGKSLGSIRRQKAALSTEELKMFLGYKPQNRQEEFGQDFFLLSLLCSGANIGDILRLRNSNIDHDEVTFVRSKTKKTNIEIKFRLTDDAKALFNKYGAISEADPNSLIFPYLANVTSEKNLENRIKKVIRQVNIGLKDISDKLGLRKITTYTARHSYATLLMNKGMSTEQIQKFLGHSSSTTTQTYLDQLSTGILDKNKSILEDLMHNK